MYIGDWEETNTFSSESAGSSDSKACWSSVRVEFAVKHQNAQIRFHPQMF